MSLTPFQMAEMYYYRMRGHAIREVTSRMESAPKDSLTKQYWAEVLSALHSKVKKQAYPVGALKHGHV